jgi:hypothetical protein
MGLSDSLAPAWLQPVINTQLIEYFRDHEIDQIID